MKKSLLIVALALIVAGSMVAGTMAQYVKAVDTSLQPSFKEFNFTAINQTAQDTVLLKIAPGETKTYAFLLSNAENNIISETDMNVYLNIIGNNLPTGMKIYVNHELASADMPVAALKAGTTEDSEPLYITAVWTSTNDDIVWEGYSQSNISLSFVAKQVLGGIQAVPNLVLSGPQSSGYVATNFKTPVNVDLSAISNDDISVAYYYLVDGKKIPATKKDGTAFIKRKWFGGYLMNADDLTTRYSKGNDTPSALDIVPAGTNLTTSAFKGYSYLYDGWSTANSGAPLFVSVSIFANGVTYESTAQVPN